MSKQPPAKHVLFFMPFDTEWPITLSASIGIKGTIMQSPEWEFGKGVKRMSIVHLQIISPSHTHTHIKVNNIYYLYVCPTRCHEADQERMPVWIEMPSGGKEGSSWGEKKARTIQSLWMRYFRCRMDIRVEIWQSVPALMGSGIDNDQWLGQWDVSMQAGRLIKWH